MSENPAKAGTDPAEPATTQLMTAKRLTEMKFPEHSFRPGYDIAAVDDALDEAADALRYYEKAAAGGVLGGGGIDPGELAKARRDLETARGLAKANEARALQAEAQYNELLASRNAAPTVAPESERAAGILFLAQKVYDERLEQGQLESDELVAKGRREAERITREADELATQVIGDAEAKASTRTREGEEAYRRSVAEGERQANSLSERVRMLQSRQEDLISTIRGTVADVLAVVGESEAAAPAGPTPTTRSGSRAASTRS